MRSTKLSILAILFLCFSSHVNAQVTFSTTTDLCQSAPWALVFHDEFSGTSIDLSKWITYNPRWNSVTNSYYNSPTGASATDAYEMVNVDDGASFYDAGNVQVSGGNCLLKLTYDPQTIYNPATGYNTYRHFKTGKIFNPISFQSGKFEIRCKLPRQGGAWAAFWALGQGKCITDVPTPTYPGTSDINFFEYLPCETDLTAVSTSCDRYQIGSTCTTYSGPVRHFHVSDVDNWHTYATEWDENFIRMYVDGNQVMEYSRYEYQSITGPQSSGCWPGSSVYNGSFDDNGQTWFPFYDPNHWMQAMAELKMTLDLYTYDLAGICTPKWESHDEIDEGTYMEWLIDYIRIYQRQDNIQQGLRDVCPSIEGPSTICIPGPNGPIYTYNITNQNSFYNLQWAASEGVQIVSTANGQLSVRFLIEGNHYITASWAPYEEGCYTTTTFPIVAGAPSTPNVNVVSNYNAGHWANTLTITNPLNYTTYNWSIYGNPGYVSKTGKIVSFTSNYDPINYSVIAKNACGTSTYDNYGNKITPSINLQNNILVTADNNYINIGLDKAYQTLSENIELGVYDVSGKQIIHQRVATTLSNIMLDIKELPSGTYFLHIKGLQVNAYRIIKP